MRNHRSVEKQPEPRPRDQDEEKSNEPDNSVEQEKLSPEGVEPPVRPVLKGKLAEHERALERDAPELLEDFYDLVQKLGERAEAAIGGMARSKCGLAATLRKRSQKAEQRFENKLFLEKIAQLQQACQSLEAELSVLDFKGRNFHPDGKAHENAGKGDWEKRLKKEKGHLVKLARGDREATDDLLQGIDNNLGGLSAEIGCAKNEGPGALVNNDVHYSQGVLDIDVISPDEKTWIEVKNKKPFGLESSNWTDEIEPKALKMLAASKEAPYSKTVEHLVFDFPKGVRPDVRDKLRELGFEVRGPVVQRPDA